MIVCRRVFILIDARHGIKTSDMEIIELIGRYHIPSQVYPSLLLLEYLHGTND